jgi:hypothetical protein
MTDSPSSEFIKTAPDFPPAWLPTHYSDGVMNFSPSPTVVRFWLCRFDPNAHAKPEYTSQPVAQIVMQTPSFVQTAIFFERALNMLLAAGTITEEQIEEARKVDASVTNAK